MKKTFYFFAFIVCVSVLLPSCSKEEVSFDQTLLYGKWKSGTSLYEVYESNGNGKTWDTSDDVSEDEAQPFTWTLTEDNLLQIHKGEMGQSVPRSLSVTELSATSLKYKEAGRSFSFAKVN